MLPNADEPAELRGVRTQGSTLRQLRAGNAGASEIDRFRKAGRAEPVFGGGSRLRPYSSAFTPTAAADFHGTAAVGVLWPAMLDPVYGDTTSIFEGAGCRGDVPERLVPIFHFTGERSSIVEHHVNLTAFVDPANLIAVLHNAIGFAVFSFGINRYGIAVCIKSDIYRVVHSGLFHFI